MKKNQRHIAKIIVIVISATMIGTTLMWAIQALA